MRKGKWVKAQGSLRIRTHARELQGPSIVSWCHLRHLLCRDHNHVPSVWHEIHVNKEEANHTNAIPDPPMLQNEEEDHEKDGGTGTKRNEMSKKKNTAISKNITRIK